MDPLAIPAKLYGRDRDIAQLIESFERISCGHGEVVLVHGLSGAGKTSLVNELQLPIGARNGFFVRGKFNQYQQNVPYLAFRQALAELCRELQGGDAWQRSRFRTEIQKALGNNGQLLVELVPEFASFLGPQPSPGTVSPQEARHRFAEMLRNFLGTVCRPEHPLVIFIDDWQWADAASLELLRQVQVGISQRYLLFIVSYRDNEVDAAHPLSAALSELRMHNVPTLALPVRYLTASDVREMICDTLKPAVEDGEGLAAMIHGRTLGNPFFVRSYLLFLHEQGLVRLDGGRGWRWRAGGEEDLPTDVVELFALKLRHLEREPGELLSLAACLGSRFDLESLAIISGLECSRCLSLLLSPHTRDIFVEEASAPRQVFSFVHDRWQQAAYMLVPPEERPALLLRIGRLLLQSLPPEQLSERLFEVVNDLNAGAPLVRDEAERLRLVELNVAAARNAYQATAYSSALSYYRAAASFLGDAGFGCMLWRDCHQVALELFKELAVCEFLCGDRGRAESSIREAVARAASPLEKADALCILIVQYTLLARYPEAIRAGREALASLGISLPEGEYHAARDAEIARFREDLGGRPVAFLATLPLMTDPGMLMATKILITMGPPCYRSHQQLWSVIVPKVVNLTLAFGNIPQVGYSHTAFGGLLGWVDDDYATARELGELATRLMTDTFTNPADQSVFYLMVGSSVRHWYSHLRHASQDYRDAYQIGLRSSNLQYAAYAFGHNMYCQFYQGVPLPELVLESRRSLEFSRVRLNMWACDLLEGGLHIFGLLSGDPAAAGEVSSWSEEEYLERVAEHGNIQVACIYRIIKACHLLLLGDCREALKISEQAEPLIYTVGTQGLLPWPEHVFARFLMITSLYRQEAPRRQQAWRGELGRIADRLGVWAKSSAENFRHKHLLACAELARIDGRGADAVRLYDQAVEAAREGEFLQWVALACERAHLFWLEAGDGRLAHSFWQQAYICYHRWGADAKVRRMEGEFSASLACNLPAGPQAGRAASLLERETREHLVARQLEQLREYALQVEQNAQRVEAVTQARELARATQQLRIEIAERKQTEEALRRSEERFRKLFMEAPLGIALIDSLTGEIHEVNPMFAAILGGREDVVQSDWVKLTHPEELAADQEQMAATNAGGVTGFKREKRYLLPDGAEIWTSMTVAPVAVKDQGRPQHLCMIEDITPRKEAEKAKREFDLQLLQTQKLESLGVLAGGIAHDFNNILMAIMGNADLALMKLPGDSPIADHLHAIESASARAADLAKQMLAYSGKGRFVVQPVDLNRVLEEMMHMLKVSISKKAELFLDRSCELPPVEVDVTQIRQVIMNLVINASEAIGDSPGVIAIRTGAADCDREYLRSFSLDEGLAEGRYASLEVSDTGCGMDAETMSKIFDPFFTTKFLGRGLGMAAVLGIMRGHNAGIRVFSETGEGTTFRLLFPASTKGAVPEVSQPVTDGWNGKGKVLLVDDEETVLETGIMMLRSLGFTPVIARNGKEALEVAGSEPDLSFVILDLTMPHMDGEQCFRELHRMRPELKVIMSSGYSEQEVAPRFLREGVANFIQKPYKLYELREVVKGVAGAR